VSHCRRIMLEELQRRNFAPITVRSYLSAVERFARYFKCRPDRLNQTHLRRYHADLLRTGQLKPRTVRLHVAALRFFFVKTLKGALSRRRYAVPEGAAPPATILSVEEMARVIDADGLYHRTMLMVLYATGMRSAELLVSATSARLRLDAAPTISRRVARSSPSRRRPHPRPRRQRHAHTLVALPAVWRADAHRRTADRPSALCPGPPRRHPL
jgi:site-specific recombinase XerD